MNAHPALTLERNILRALPGVFLDGADLRLHPVANPQDARVKADGIFELAMDGRRIPVYVEVKGRYSPEAEEQLRHWAALVPEAIVLLVLPKTPRAVRSRLREAGINHADLTGTIYLRAPGIRIDIAGTRRPPRLSTQQRVNPFSKRASLVVRALLTKRGPGQGVTALAEHLGLAKGWVSQVCSELVARDWVESTEHGLMVKDSVSLLRAWSLEYTWRDNESYGFTVPFEHDELLKRLPLALAGLRWGLTLQSGAGLVVPHVHYQGQLHLYVDPAHHTVATKRVEDLLHGELSVKGGNLQLMGPYYGPATFYDLRQRGQLPVVSPVQLFLDLAYFPVRGAETATALARGVLERELDLEPADVRRLVQDLA